MVIKGLKRSLMFVVGKSICKAKPLAGYKRRLFSSWQFLRKRKGLDNLLFPCAMDYWLRYEYLAEKDPDKREALKEAVMGGENGKAWARSYDIKPHETIGRLSYDQACPLLKELDERIASFNDPILVVQIGSSSGREIGLLAKKYPRHQYIGTDIYPEVIAYSSEHYPSRNLSFELCSAKKICSVLSANTNRKIIIFSSGSLQFVQPEHMEIFFRSIAQVPCLEILLLEPASESQQSPVEMTGSHWRGNFSYTHNYRYYAEKAGLNTKKCQIIKPFFPAERYPIHQWTVNYYYWGTMKNVPSGD